MGIKIPVLYHRSKSDKKMAKVITRYLPEQILTGAPTKIRIIACITHSPNYVPTDINM